MGLVIEANFRDRLIGLRVLGPSVVLCYIEVNDGMRFEVREFSSEAERVRVVGRLTSDQVGNLALAYRALCGSSELRARADAGADGEPGDWQHFGQSVMEVFENV